MTIWMARAALGLWLAALVTKRRPVWIAAYLVYLAHVALAFTYSYSWSHEVALRETARQTRELFGVDSGAGLYLNYLLTAAWGADCFWGWQGRAWRYFLHGLLAFLFVNASAVVWVIRALR